MINEKSHLLTFLKSRKIRTGLRKQIHHRMSQYCNKFEQSHYSGIEIAKKTMIWIAPIINKK